MTSAKASPPLSSFSKYSKRRAQPASGRRADSAAKPLLKIDRLSVKLDGKTLLDDVSLHLSPGECLALTGESGSGKSLTALSVMGLLPTAMKQSGRITLQDTDLTTLSERAYCKLRGRRVGLIFQEPMTTLNPLHTIGQQISETLRIHGRRATRTDLRDLMTRVGLDVPPTRYPHELSGGQRQRVVIAMAIAMKPALLIADEPTTALDVTTQAQILSLLKSLSREEDMGLMMITHDLAVVADMADRIAVMKDGRIVETATPDAIFARPTQDYTRALIKASGHRADLSAPTKDGQTLLSAEGMSISYPQARRHPFAKAQRFTAVRDVSFQIAKGERVGLVGESGCGKSTLTRALLGLQAIDTGEITLDGAPLLENGQMTRAARRRIQVVFQDPYGSFNPRHRVARLLAEPFHLLDTPPRGAAREQAVAEALTEVGLSPLDANKHIHAFSGGQRQRLAIARALIIRPDLIVLDEAVSALDVRVRAQVLDLLADLSRRHGLAWLFISHDLTVVRSVTDRVLVMRKGEIVEEGPTEDVYTAPRHPYTRSLLDAAPRLPEHAPGDN